MAGLALILFCLAVYLPGQAGIPAVDRDESRFAQASRQMLAAPIGEAWVVPKVQDRPRLNKPPLIYWLQAGSAGLFTGRWFGRDLATCVAHDAIWMYRVPSMLAAILAVLATWRLGCSMFDPRAACAGALLLAVCPAFWWEAHQARADMVLVACTTLAMWALWEIVKRIDRSSPSGAGRRQPPGQHADDHSSWKGHLLRAGVLWLAVGAGIMTKGPVTLMVVILAAITFALLSRRLVWLWTRLHPLVGVVIVAACIAPWLILLGRYIGFDVYVERVKLEVVGRSLEAQEGHSGPPGYHLLLAIPLLGAASLLAGAALLRAIGRGLSTEGGGGFIGRIARSFTTLRAERRGEAFLLCWIVPSWIVFELVRTKLPHYTMPLYPAIALLCGRAVLAATAGAWKIGEHRVQRALGGLWIVAMQGAIIAGMLAIGYALPHRAVPIGAVGAIGLALVAFDMRLAIRALRANDWWLLQRTGILAVVVLALGLAFAASRIPEASTSKRIAGAIEIIDPRGERAIAMPNDDGAYREDSMIFETRGRATMVPLNRLDAWAAANPRGLVLWESRLPEPPANLHERYEVAGFNYAKGRKVRVQIMEVVP